jgi:HAMP domain-containing protein
LLTVSGLFLLALLIVALRSNFLQRVVTTPIIKLANKARNITSSQNYYLRADKTSNDEIGLLVMISMTWPGSSVARYKAPANN